MTIGAADDIEAMQLDDVPAVLPDLLPPGECVAVIAGDIETERAFDLAERYFGELPPGTQTGAGHGGGRR